MKIKRIGPEGEGTGTCALPKIHQCLAPSDNIILQFWWLHSTKHGVNNYENLFLTQRHCIAIINVLLNVIVQVILISDTLHVKQSNK